MRVSACLLGLAGLSAASSWNDHPLMPRQANNTATNGTSSRNGTTDNSATILSDLSNINDQIIAINASLGGIDINAANPPLAQLLSISGASSTLGNSVQSATSSINSSSSPFGQSLDLAIAAVSLQPALFNLLDNFIRYAPTLSKNAAIAKIIYGTLNTQRQMTADLGNSLAAKLAEPYKTESAPVNNQIGMKFTAAVNAYAPNSTNSSTPSNGVSSLGQPGAGFAATNLTVAWLNRTRADIGALNSSFNGLSGAIPLTKLETITAQAMTISLDLQNTIQAASQAKPYNISEANSVAVAILGVQASTTSLLQTFSNFYSAFSAQGLTYVVTSQLQGQRELTVNLSLALVYTLPVPYLYEAPALLTTFLAAFDSTIKTYNQSSTTSSTPSPSGSTGAASSFVVPAVSSLAVGTIFAVLIGSGVGALLVI